MNSTGQLASAPVSTRHPRLPVAQLRTGLFVADLDRPWLDTPFLLQGFLIESDDEIETLRRHCRFVHIDVQMSDPVVVRALQAALESGDESGPAADAEPPIAPLTRAVAGEPEVDDALRDASPLGLIDAPPPEPMPPAQVRREPAPRPRAADTVATPVSMRVVRSGVVRSGAAPADRPAGARRLPAITDDTRERFRAFARGASEGADPSPVPARRGLFAALGSLFEGLEHALPPAVRARLVDRRAARALERRLAQGAQELDGPPPAMSVDADTANGSRYNQAEGEVLRTSEARLGGEAEQDSRAAAKRARAAKAPPTLDRELDALLPPTVVRKPYPVRRPVAEALPEARQAWQRGGRSLEAIFADVRASRGVQLVQAQEAVSSMVESMIDNPDAMLWVAQLRETDLNVYQHGVRSALYMIAVGRSLGFPKDMIESLGLIGLLADVGKVRVPRALIDKPGILSRAEFSIVKEHVELGITALETDGVKLNADVRAGILQHHERLDGSGYPAGLKGTEISIYGRIAGIADVFSALTTARPYANALAVQDALMGLYQWADTSFHAPLVEQFVQAVGVFPVGSLVELSNAEVAVVLAHNRSRRLEPRVIVLADASKRPLAAPFERDLFKQAVVKGVKPVRIQRGLPAGAYGLKPHDFYADEALALAKAD
ncbi:MAG: HD domain-containing phosphohydrolase [Burkholderiales bacterium]